ncbi:SLIT-ROBO Rho GTPase-activating protein 1-like [Lethenteron reissneri]|uniref:SLIT-ROBO Rho GTPase-activating protein 1-like n=1 Tax=Lethenteron reissneri TaxID=7753 RepID=UPI002AB6CFF8|nr:SLIT-ROBO Rho GTPase-activating protein 1-like [Lethenteron reissneri]
MILMGDFNFRVGSKHQIWDHVRGRHGVGLHHEGIFRISGSLTQMTEIKSAFERGEDPLDDDDDGRTIDSVAGVLKAYFRGLEKPLFPSHMYQDFLDCIKISEYHKRIAHLRDLIRKLPGPVIVVLRYLFTFLNHLSGFRDENMMDQLQSGGVLGPTLAPVPPEFRPDEG